MLYSGPEDTHVVALRTLKPVNHARLVGASKNVVGERQPYVLIRKEGLWECRYGSRWVAQQACKNKRILMKSDVVGMMSLA